MYQVIRSGKLLGQYDLFVDAWLDVFLSSGGFCVIVGVDGETWHVDPALAT